MIGIILTALVTLPAFIAILKVRSWPLAWAAFAAAWVIDGFGWSFMESHNQGVISIGYFLVAGASAAIAGFLLRLLTKLIDVAAARICRRTTPFILGIAYGTGVAAARFGRLTTRTTTATGKIENTQDQNQKSELQSAQKTENET